ncbi:MAG: hypothetical protein GX591_01435 [Planctomycetes bacterium]|nr:hypothetical protein [Planctomycetota bacterium]
MTVLDLPFIETDLKLAADPRSWERGVEYFSARAAEVLMVRNGTVYARVAGSGAEAYRVEVWAEGGRVHGRCTCPVGNQGVFCKHCVATALTYLDGRPGAGQTGQDIRAYLEAQDKDALIDLVMDRLPWDDDLRRSLKLQAACHGRSAPDVDAYRKAIADATAVPAGGRVAYLEVPRFVQRIAAVVDGVEDLLASGYAAEAVGLIEDAVARCQEAAGRLDDSDGRMGEMLHRLGTLHHAACAAARPDPADLARRLFRMELRDAFGVFAGVPEVYGEILGSEGLAVYGRQVEARWSKLAALAPGDDPARRYRRNRYRLTSMMESLARRSGDVGRLAEVMSRDLASPDRFLRLARAYQRAGRPDEALRWALRGLDAFPEAPRSALEAFVADEYHRRGRHDEAMAVMWRQFQRDPDLRTYARLKEHADRAGQWPRWRPKALRAVEAAVSDAMRRPRGAPGPPPDRSVLVEIYLWEDDVQSAWAEAHLGGCSESLWMRLAALREADHPADAAAIYRKRIEPLVALANNRAYAEAAALLGKLKALLARLGRRGEFDAFLADLRAAHRRKRNFIAMTGEL